MSTTTRGARRTTSTRSARPRVEVVRAGPNAETLLVGSVAVLCLLGLVMVYSASSVTSVQRGGRSWDLVARQAGFMVVGLGAAVAASRVAPRAWRDRIGGPLLVVSGLLLGVLALDRVLGMVGHEGLPIAISVNGATRWLGYGPLRLQPSDLAKLGLVLWLARFLDLRHRSIGSTDLLQPVLTVTGVLALLVMFGDDLGTTMLLGIVMLTMLFLAGAPIGQVGKIAAVGAGIAVIAIFGLERFRMNRIAAFLHPELYRETEGYQLWQSQISFATGGVWGTGPGNSRAKWGYLPQADTDFILAVIGEELGLIGSVVVLGAFAVFMLAGIRLALRCPTRFGRYAIFGITTWIGVQALINIGVAVGTLPTKGITLPFVSYGGSSLIMCMAAVGVVLSLSRSR